jgi:lysophospholipase L1-like esterase
MSTDILARGLGVAAKKSAFLAKLRKRRGAMNKVGALGGASGTGLSNGTETGKTYRQIVFSPVGSGVWNPTFVYSNWQILASGEVDTPNDITVKAYLEVGSVSYPIIFRGAKTVVISPGCQVESEPLGLLIPANTLCYVRTYVSVTSGQWPLGRLPHTGSGEGGNAVAGTTGADAASGTGALAGNQNVYMYGPIAINGEMTVPTVPCVGFLGDSIGTGTNDTVQTNGYFGYIERALGNAVSWISNVRSSTKLNDFNTTHHRRMAHFPQLITHLICELIRNDIASDGVALSVAQSRSITCWNEFLNRSIPVWAVTCTPTTTTTDAWATLANQTVTASEAVRTAYNDWLRAGAPIVAGVAVAIGTAGALLIGQTGHPLAGYFDVADQCESARNSGKWRVDLGTPTTDGVHPNAVVHAQIATIINPAVFVIN